jgi:cytochrome c556
MIRTLSAVVMIVLAVSVAIAQQDPIAARKALMKENADQAKIGAAMAKGEVVRPRQGAQDFRNV